SAPSTILPVEDGPAPRALTGRLWTAVSIFAVLMTAFHIFAVFKPIPAMQLRAAHLMFALPLIFILYPLAIPRLRVLDFLLTAVGLVTSAYFIREADGLILYRMGAANLADLVFGTLLVILVLEATR